jgi:hypothetical protein
MRPSPSLRNSGPRVVERVRLKLGCFETAGGMTAGPAGPCGLPDTEWILDMPRKDWNPCQLSRPPDAPYEAADPLMPGQDYEFAIVHYDGGPHDWARCRGAVSVEVCELKLQA